MEMTPKYGELLSPSIKITRQYFREMVKLLGIYVLYRSPLPGKQYTTYGEIESAYKPPKLIGCIFTDHPDQYTLKKLGWVSELQENASIIHVDYDLEDLQQGCLFIVPSGLDDGKGRLFRVVKISTQMVYPSSVACMIVPEWEDTMDEEQAYDYTNSSFTLLNEESDKVMGDYESVSTDK